MALMREHWRPLLHNHIAVLHATDELDPNFALAARNVWNFEFYDPKQSNVYDIVKRHQVIITEKGLHELQAKLQNTTKVKYVVDMPVPKIADMSPINVPKVKRKQVTAERQALEKRERLALLEKYPHVLTGKDMHKQRHWSKSRTFSHREHLPGAVQKQDA